MLLIGVFILLPACSESGNEPLSYDPPGSTNTEDKEITPQVKKTFAFEEQGLWFSNDFEGARLNDVAQVDSSTYQALLNPENAPINNSAWYAFKVWARDSKSISMTLQYENGDHRYIPKLSRDGEVWVPIDSLSHALDTTTGTATIQLDVDRDTLWVSAQELITSQTFEKWMADYEKHPHVTRTAIGNSAQGRPLSMLEITSLASPSNYVLVISRQHPPEVTGTLAALPFLEAVASDSELAEQFRQKFSVLAVPLMNPDGVDNGHWRHNAHGVDLNRDWRNVNQPEVQVVQQAFLQLKQVRDAQVFFAIDFHSTQEDVFYTLSRDLETRPANFTDTWLDRIRVALPDYFVNDEPYGLGSPVSKNWFYETFQAPAVTYEVGDESDRTQIGVISTIAAEAMMEVLLEEIE